MGLRANAAQFSLLVVVNALVGAVIGQERTVLPLLADAAFGITAVTATTTFVMAFGATKAVANLFTGALTDRIGRKPVLVAGWLVALPVPPLLIWAPSWGWIIAANAVLGVNQGMTWSATVIMKIDLAGPSRRGLALGINEAAGYGAVALSALVTGEIAARHGLRPAPFLLGAAFVAVGLGLSAVLVRETSGHARLEADQLTEDRAPGTGASRGRGPSPHGGAATADGQGGAFSTVFVRTTWRDRSLSAVSQAGLVNNAIDGLAWGLLPLLFAAGDMSVGRIGVLAAIYPAVWCIGQLFAGAWSDVIGRKPLIVSGMVVQAGALGVVATANGFRWWAIGSALLGAGTALVYPTLIAAVGDVAHPSWRASAVGVYRLWRDAGYVVGALVSGIVADVLGLRAAVWALAAMSAASGLVVAVRMTAAGVGARPRPASASSI